jgi:hypothetical protein
MVKKYGEALATVSLSNSKSKRSIESVSEDTKEQLLIGVK